MTGSEGQLQLIIDTIPSLVWTARPDGFCDFLNQRWLHYAGMTAPEAQGWGWADAIHPDDRKGVVDYWRSCLASGTRVATQARIRSFDGSHRWFLISANPLRDESGNIVGWYGTNTDIEDRKKAEEALRSSERNLSLLINAIPTFIHVLRTDGSVLYVNPMVLDYTGLTLEDVQKEDYRARHPEDVDRLREERRQALTRPVPFENEQRVLGKDGKYRWFLIRYNPLLDERGRIDRWYVTATDIEDRKRAEQELKRSEAFLAEGQRLSRTGSFSWCIETDEITWSDELYRIFELDQRLPVTLERIASRVYPDDLPLMQDMIQQARHAASDFEYKHRLLMPDQSVKHVHLFAHVTRDQHGRLEYVGAAQDVTRQEEER